MKFKTLLAAMLMTAMASVAQDDPVIMTINGQPVLRSEFEYSYNKNNTDGVIDKKTVTEYVDLFVNYKLKVVAALDARLDTLASFKSEFAQYRDQQVRPTMITDADVEAEARNIYKMTADAIGADGQLKMSHILLMVRQRGDQAKLDEAKVRIDSIYNALKNGADFGELAKQYSQDPGSAKNGGELPWIRRGQTYPEFENVVFALQPGQMSEPFLSPAGYHIVLMKERKEFEPFEFHRESIMKFIEARNMRENIINDKIDVIVRNSNGQITYEQLMEQRADSLTAIDPEMKNLIAEYYDGLLLFEISNRTVWEKAAKDEEGLAKFFKANKKKYKWDEPRFKGIAYHVKQQADVEAVRNCVKDVPFDEWADKLRTGFNKDSVIRIRVEKGLFKKGDNDLIDRDVFKVDTIVAPMKDYPVGATYGKLLKKPEDYTDVRGIVTADYQEYLEKEWVAELRRKYAVVVDEQVLRTVNKH